MADTSLRRSPLHDHHLALGAKCAPFAGWEMPMEYANGGVIAEHTAVRESVGVFDVSHLGKVRVTGPGAAAFVNRCLTNDLDKLTPGQAQYTLCCDPTTGGVIDDLIAYRISDDEIFLVPNAANAAEVVRRLTEAAPEGITVTDEHDRYAVLAVQGPASERVLEAMGLPAAHDYMSFVTAPYEGADVLVCRTGYTGEHGYELIVPTDHAVKVWDALFAEGEPYSIRACGLGARDTLRTEMGYPLHGQDLSPEITPLQARCGWAVGWKKDTFWGREALLAEKQAGPRRLLRGLKALDRGVLRAQLAVLDGDRRIGVTTSGTFSPTLKIGIALALIDTDAGIEDGQRVTVDVRGRALACEVVKPPFVEAKTR